MALLMTMNDDLPPLPEVEELESPKPRNQWHQQILAQANEPPVSHKHWPTQSQAIVEPRRGYDFDSQKTVKITGFNIRDVKITVKGGRGYDWPDNEVR